MNPTRESALFAVALEKPVEKRPMFLDAVCEGDDELRQRLEASLAANEQADTLLAAQPERKRRCVQWSAPSPATKRRSSGSPLRDGIEFSSDRRGRRSEHARARVLPNSNCIVTAEPSPRSWKNISTTDGQD